MQRHLLLVEKTGELPHYCLLDCDSSALKRQLNHCKGAYPARDGYQIHVVQPGSYTQPLGEELKIN